MSKIHGGSIALKLSPLLPMLAEGDTRYSYDTVPQPHLVGTTSRMCQIASKSDALCRPKAEKPAGALLVSSHFT
ncbi:hypothetical protein [Luteimonas sp. FCS-9]|uniref:hypothetical protein n=1 Tax=Luteimonas sp. FCS-9 TaxID=1547516 RepID=UPI000AE4C3F5|nr:hypothetical protein [Luteimonas sp. FCS-9]